MNGRVNFLIELKRSLKVFDFVFRIFSMYRCSELVEATISPLAVTFFPTLSGKNAALDKVKATLDDVSALFTNFATFSIHFFYSLAS